MSEISDTVFTPRGPLTLVPSSHRRAYPLPEKMASAPLVEPKTTFSSFSHLLDARILRALADMGFAHPTLIQAKSIPLALENKDILARARTGSGKTAAYCIPLVQKILNSKPAVGAPLPARRVTQGLMVDFKGTRGLILVPTKELAEQVTRHLKQLIVYLDEEVTLANAASGTTAHLQRCFPSHHLPSHGPRSELFQNNDVGEARYRRRNSLADTVSITVQSANWIFLVVSRANSSLGRLVRVPGVTGY